MGSRPLSPTYQAYIRPSQPPQAVQRPNNFNDEGSWELQPHYKESRDSYRSSTSNDSKSNTAQPYNNSSQAFSQQSSYQQHFQSPTNNKVDFKAQQHQYQSNAQPQTYQAQVQDSYQNNTPAENYSNPKTAFFHLLFKGSAILFYIVGTWLTSSFVLQFVVIVLLMAIDFWTVKNVSGRILVGLRYWNESDEQGNSIWRFESLDKQSLERLNKKDTTLFWTSLYVTPTIWGVFGIVAALKLNFDYLIIIIIALVLCAPNIIGFTKCHKDAKNKVQSYAQHAMGGFMREAMTGSITNGVSKIFNIF